MKKFLLYSISYLLVAIAGISLYLFFLYGNSKPELSNNCFLIGFLSLCLSLILLRLKPLPKVGSYFTYRNRNSPYNGMSGIVQHHYDKKGFMLQTENSWLVNIKP